MERAIEADERLTREQALGARGRCAWLAGDLARAYALLDEAELHAPEDLSIQHLLACSAQALGAREFPNIARFATELASTLLGRARDEDLSDEQRFYALVTLARFGPAEQARCAIEPLSVVHGAFVSLHADALAHADDPLRPHAFDANLDLTMGLRWAAAFRVAQLAALRSAHDAAHAGHESLRALATRLQLDGDAR
jgi:hypothetical protein